MVDKYDPQSFSGSIKEFESLGQYLRYIRESKGISIDIVVTDTRIRKIYLEALEEEDYEQLPERTYALGYLRAYANYLDISNVEELVNHLDRSYNFHNPIYGDEKQKDVSRSLRKKISTASYKDNKLDSVKPKVEATNKVAFSAKTSRGEDLDKKNKKIVLILAVIVVLIGIFIGVLVSIVAGNYNKSHSANVNLANDKEIIDNISNTIKGQDFVVVEQSSDGNTEELEGENSEMQHQANLNPQEGHALTSNAVANNNVSTNSNVAINERAVLPFPAETKAKEISIVFFEDVWVKIYSKSNPNVVYIDKIFKSGSTFEVPGVENLSIDIGNYRGLYFVVDATRLYLNSSRGGRVLKNVTLDKDYLLKTYN